MELPKRKPTRLKGYDYSIPGMYFLTICVKDRKQLLGEIVGCGNLLVMTTSSEAKKIIKRYGNILIQMY